MSIQREIDRIKGNIAASYAGAKEKGGTMPEVQDSGNLPEAIRSIPDAPGTPLDPAEVYRRTRPADWLPMPEPADNEIYLLLHIPDGASSLLAFTVTCTGSYTAATGSVKDGAFVQSGAASIASGQKYEAELFADDYGSLTSSGMKQCVVKISGTDILSWEPAVHSKKPLPSPFSSWNIVELACRLPKAARVRCGSSTASGALRKLKYFSWYGSNHAADMSSMFYNCGSLTAVLALDSQAATNMANMFYNCYSLAAIPPLDTKAVTNMSGMFRTCNVLTAIPLLDTSAVTDMSYMFYLCRALPTIPQLDVAQVTTMSNMFYGCYALVSVPPLDTRSVTNMGQMFRNCYALASVSSLDTSAVKDMNYMFQSCYALTTIPPLDTSAVTNMSYMFQNCYALTAIPPLDTSVVTNMSYMFYGCCSLATLPSLDVRSATTMQQMFQECSSLTAIERLNPTKVTNMASFANCLSLTRLRLDPSVTGWTGYNISLANSSMDRLGLVELFNSLPTVSQMYSRTLTLTGTPGAAELTEADKAIAAGKNWTLVL